MYDKEFATLLHDTPPDRPFKEAYCTRADWQALEPKFKGLARKGPATVVFTTFTGTNTCEHPISCVIGVQRLQKYYMEVRELSDLPYSFVVGGNGFVFECRGWKQQPLLPEKYEYLEPYAIHIGYIGRPLDCSSLNRAMMDSRNDLIKFGMDQSHLAKRILTLNCYK